MKKEDKIFIVISVVLMILFIVSVAEKVIGLAQSKRPYSELSPIVQDEILTRLKEADLEPKEAGYYRVIE